MHIGYAGPLGLAQLDLDAPPGLHAFPFTGLLLQEWLALGHRVTACVLVGGQREVRSIRRGNLVVQLIPMRSQRQRLTDLYRIERRLISEVLSAAKPDVISAHWTYEYALAALKVNPRAFVTAHDTPVRAAWAMRSPSRAYKNLMALPVSRQVVNLSAVSPYAAQHFEKTLRVHRPIRVIPNGVALDHQNMAFRTAHVGHIPDSVITVLNGWNAIKNGKGALRAFSLVSDGSFPGGLIMIGAGHEPDGPAERWARRKGLARNVRFTGSKSHDETMELIRARGKTLLHPSRLETHPLTLVEAMAIGVPVVAGSKSGGVAWCLENGTSGYLCDVRNPADMAAALLRSTDSSRAAIMSAARSRVETTFDIKRVATSYISWFEDDEG